MSDSNKRKGKKTSNDLQSTLDSLRRKGVTIGLVDGRLKYQGDISRATKDELQVIKANRETLCLLLEIESTTCDDTPESESDRDRESDSDDKDTKLDTKQSKQAKPTSSLTLDITPNMSQAQIEERIRQYNERVRLEREEINAKRKDKSLIEVSLGVFRSRAEVERENNTYIFEPPGRKYNVSAQQFEARLNQFREWTESHWRERE